MKVGTKSLLFGVHQIFIHPIFVLWGWVKLYSWPNWKEFVCILIHDWGYWGCGDMDREEGAKHPKWAALKVLRYLDNMNLELAVLKVIGPERDFSLFQNRKYYYICLNHSRFLCVQTGNKPSKLCWADKLGTALMPIWLWVFLGKLSGEIDEYMESFKHREYIQENNPHKYFEAYKNKIVPKLLKDNLQYSTIIGRYSGPCIHCQRALEQKNKLFCRWNGEDVTELNSCCGAYLSESDLGKYPD